ncbi:hypothetical protein [Aporhodopirellula aestuarii]|uniref:Uncharacterized protein n=1 Tax=Aporhodopirellula aestuarii TaxID=2950107 RepID=A0ABT0U7B4_9BACT|nr:hypothetical protein [Aporhodopirellula aestuarii]MCM2372795.1 hypothetical protein [Aporhodopirellula aestuarii]
MSPLVIYLRVIGGAAILAFAAAVMPSSWMIAIAAHLGIEPFPDSPLTFYLARNLSLLYGYVGAFLLLVAADLARYRPLVWWAAVGTISFGVLQWIADAMAGMPSWWTYGESGSTFFGGVLLWWLDARTSKNAAT